ncbi:MAG: ABC transporter permease [Phycisphaerales bacterium]
MAHATHAVTLLGGAIFDRIAGFGAFVRFALATLAALVEHPARCLRWRQLAPQLLAVGTASVPVVAVTGCFIGMILAVEGFAQFEAIGASRRIGGIINVSVVKQIGPVLAAVMVAGRVGGAIAAELGTMKVTEQLDAMRAMAASPIVRLVAPRFVACLVMTPILTVFSDLLGAWGAWVVVVKLFGVSSTEYWHYTAQFMVALDPVNGLIKATAFGAAIGFICCYKGFTCGPGAEGVGRAATSAFVASFIAIVAINLVLVDFLQTVTRLVYGGISSAL